MSLLIKTDVTAIKILYDFVLAGIGSYLHIFSLDNHKLLYKLKALNAQKIYGIVPNEDKNEILIFGGKQFNVVSTNDNIELWSVKCHVQCNDWLLSGIWLDGRQIGLLTAHNVVQIWDTLKLSLKSTHKSQDCSILYSGHMVKLDDCILVFSGTVYSEILIRSADNDELLKTLKGHRGVIFSIAYNKEKELIVSTSDDRSVCIWGPKYSIDKAPNTIDYWRAIDIECKHEVYGHLARVMRCVITNDFIVSVGEDAGICVWDFNGNLDEKKISHQNAAIWSVDCEKDVLVTGGGDGGIVKHRIKCEKDVCEDIDLGEVKPKKLVYTARNAVVLTDQSELIYIDVDTRSVLDKIQLKHDSTYFLLALSSCKQLIATIDMLGNLDLFAETCKGEPSLCKLMSEKLDLSNIYSMHWTENRFLVLCTDAGNITVLCLNGNKVVIHSTFKLPNCKEKYLTAVSFIENKNVLIVGDRCGNIHSFIVGKESPVSTIPKLHGRYGPTSIGYDHIVYTTGRDGKVHNLTLDESGTLSLKFSKNMPFDWVEKFLDRDKNLICGFKERVFVVFDLKLNSIVLEVPCGGGHRSWDAVRWKDARDNVHVKILYTKNSSVKIVNFNLDAISSKSISNGLHISEINCMTVFNINDAVIMFSGGEDTNFRISEIDKENNDIKSDIVSKHLSNVRALETVIVDNKIVIVTGGGRAQICINEYDINSKKMNNILNFQVQGTDKDKKRNWRVHQIDFDAETRIMDISIHKADHITIYTGCSDSVIRAFKYKNEKLELTFQINHHSTCILKTFIIEYQNKKYLITATSRGVVAFWDLETLCNESKPIAEFEANKAGVNSIDFDEKTCVLATGGDDNAIHIHRLKIENTIERLNSKVFSNFHCAQITGLKFIGDILLSTSIDQRITITKLVMTKDDVSLVFLKQVVSDVADIHGLQVVENKSTSSTVCVYGKGVEIIRMESEFS